MLRRAGAPAERPAVHARSARSPGPCAPLRARTTVPVVLHGCPRFSWPWIVLQVAQSSNAKPLLGGSDLAPKWFETTFSGVRTWLPSGSNHFLGATGPDLGGSKQRDVGRTSPDVLDDGALESLSLRCWLDLNRVPQPCSP